MGTLVAKKYPTVLALKSADHTYVTCGSESKAWACWGGKTGGAKYRWGQGSTLRADAIAGVDEKAGVTCYLINGVCHQAANRILRPAGITVLGARGYDLSEVAFGAYGRPRGRLGLCRAPFHQHVTVTGDLPECLVDHDVGSFMILRRFLNLLHSAKEREYLSGVMRIYEMAWPSFDSEMSLTDVDLLTLQLELFMHKVRYALGNDLEQRLADQLSDVRRSYEEDRMEIEDKFADGRVDAATFVRDFDQRTFELQAQFADLLDDSQYKRLLGLDRGETITLVDPVLAEQAFIR